MGDWPKGVPLNCVDTVDYKYLCHLGVAKSANADYTAATENVYDKDGAVIAAVNYTFHPDGLDGQGNPLAYFDFTSDQTAGEPLSCSVRAIYDGSGDYTGTAGTLIEHPAHIVHYLLDRYSIGHDEIDLMTIKRMAALLQIKFAVLVNQGADGIDIAEQDLLSINDMPEMRQVFKGFNMEPVTLKYSASRESWTRGKELLVRNF
jgi:hypothetical protein